MAGDLVELDRGAGGQVVIDLTIGGPQAQCLGFRSAEDTLGRIEARDPLDVAAADHVGLAKIEADVIINVLHIDIDGSATDVMPEGQAELTAVIEVEARIPGSPFRAIETTEGHPPIADRAAIPEVRPEEAIIAHRDLDQAFGRRSGLAGDEVDQTTGRIRREDRRRTTANHLDLADGLIEPEGLVGIQIAQARVVLDGHTVLGQLHRGVAVHGNAAGANIGAGFTAGVFHPEARHIAKAVSHARHAGFAQMLLRNDADGIAGVGPGALVGTGAGSDDHRLHGGRTGLLPADDGVGRITSQTGFQPRPCQQQAQAGHRVKGALHGIGAMIGRRFVRDQDLDVGLPGEFRHARLGRLSPDVEAVGLGGPDRRCHGGCHDAGGDQEVLAVPPR